MTFYDFWINMIYLTRLPAMGSIAQKNIRFKKIFEKSTLSLLTYTITTFLNVTLNFDPIYLVWII